MRTAAVVISSKIYPKKIKASLFVCTRVSRIEKFSRFIRLRRIYKIVENNIEKKSKIQLDLDGKK